jgi:hypothetical protein
MDACYELLEDIAEIWQRQTGDEFDSVFTWGIRLDEIEGLIDQIQNHYTQ